MDLSPNDIRNYEFPNQMRGYDKEEVDNILDQVADALEQTKQENLKLSMEADSLRSQLSGLKQFEDTIKSAAIDARRNADMTIATAKQEAEMVLSKAKGDAENILANKTRDVSDIENQITKLGLTRKSYLSKIRTLIQSHMEMIDDIDTDTSQPVEPDLTAKQSDPDAISITQSTDVTTDKRESLANEPEPEETDDEVEDASVAEDLKNAIQSDDSPKSEPEAEDDQPIDPELAAALDSYKKTTAGEEPPTAHAEPQTVPPQDAIVETTARAEDIPDGFIAMADEDSQTDHTATDKVATSEPNALSGADPSVLQIDKPEAEPIEPENLAGELDEVAAKFEEAMDQADS